MTTGRWQSFPRRGLANAGRRQRQAESIRQFREAVLSSPRIEEFKGPFTTGWTIQLWLEAAPQVVHCWVVRETGRLVARVEARCGRVWIVFPIEPDIDHVALVQADGLPPQWSPIERVRLPGGEAIEHTDIGIADFSWLKQLGPGERRT